MLLNADAARIPLTDKSVHCCTTSPPYWGLRKYSGEQGRGTFPDLGLEPTPDEFIHNMVMIFREVGRVLRDDGVAWLNLGDSYAGSGKGAANYDGPISGKQKTNVGSMADGRGLPVYKNMQGGNLMLMPNRVAFALQEDGWIVRNDVIWYKRNPMPESQAGWRWEKHRIKVASADVEWREKAKERGGVPDEEAPHHRAGGNTGFGDEKPEYVDCRGCKKCDATDGLILKKGSWRHTRAHEFVFMLTKQMKYWSDQEVVREDLAESTSPRLQYKRTEDSKWFQAEADSSDMRVTDGARANPAGRNPRSVLDVPTAPYKGAHYATFPPNLIAPLIRATCPRWACPVCGQGWSPVVEKGRPEPHPDVWSSKSPHQFNAEDNIYDESSTLKSVRQINIKEYRPTCEHPHTIEEAVPGIVLDPFLGSGTTGMVAREQQLRWVGLDISHEYLDRQAKVRTHSGTPSDALDGLPMFADD